MRTCLNDELINFLNESHNEYLATNTIKSMLLKSSFKELKENEKWEDAYCDFHISAKYP